MAETYMLVKYHICYQQFCSIVIRKIFCTLLHQKNKTAAPWFWRILLGSHQKKLQVEEQHLRWTVFFFCGKKKLYIYIYMYVCKYNKCLRLRTCEELVIHYMQIQKCKMLLDRRWWQIFALVSRETVTVASRYHPSCYCEV